MKFTPYSDLSIIIYINESILFLIVCLMMIYSNGSSTIKYIDSIEHCLPDNSFILTNSSNYSFNNQSFIINSFTYSVNKSALLKYKQDISIKNQYIPVINFYLYFFLIPLVNLLYLFYCIYFKLLKNPFALPKL